MTTALGDATNTKVGGRGKTVEQIYQKKTQLEHILLRPDTYVGSIEKMTQPMWVLDPDTKRIVHRQITYVPGLFKIFDEIIVNAADNKQRDPSMTTIKVTIDCEANRISVWNDGKGIPVAIHSEHKCYVPELVFGHLLTGSNFDDDEKKTTGGRNGYGAKLTNIFSTEFTVETADSNGGKKLKQTWRDNMSKLAGKPVIQEHTSKKDYTSVSFTPDLARFKMERLDGDIVSLLARRAYDVASCATCRTVGALAVYLNGTRVPVKSFEDYIALHDGLESPVAFEKSVDGRWAVGVASSEGAFQQLSFVNSICTTKGGTHVAHIADQVASRLAGVVKRKNKGQEVKPALIKSHLAIYVDSLIVNPAFDSQTKETLTTRAAQFGSKWEPSEKFFKLIEKSGIVDRIVAFSKFKQDEQLKRKGGSKRARLTGITKLDDANYAGGARARDCTLILTEGDSAKALAVSGLGVVGRDFYGVFPLKGKPLNVREASHAAIMKNEEIQHVVQIMGLKFGVDYDESNIKSLRYGHLMIMTDQDHDGSHIKGLLINCLHHFWPSLLKLKSFLRAFITPIVKATPRSANRGQPMTFFTLPEYEEWKATLGLTRAASAWTIKYYKGLGTSTAKEAKEYFSDINKHRIDFEPLGATNELAKDSDLIDMAFSKKRAEDRKSWLRAFEQGTYVNYSAALLSYSNFINRELVLFSLADNQRSIPCVIDGLKPSQRKVLFACFKRKLRREIKVAQLAGYVSEHAAYHHGEASLVGTIVGMAQDFVGSNNINLLTPSGQFGTRIMGGKDAASPRYIFTKLEPIARTVFHPDDDAVLDYLDDDGQSIEPKFYVPVLPLALCNGAEGIGTGWATSVPNYDPRAIIAELRHLIESVGDHLDHLDYAWDGDAGACSLEPAYRGFSGDIFPKQGGNSFGCSGRIERLDDVTVHIDELPVRKWTHDYKLWLEAQIVGSDKEPAWIRDFKENHTDTTVSFTVTVLDGALLDAAQNLLGGLKAKFKLTISIAATNMNFFDDAGSIVKYDTPAHILTAFYRIRFETYQKRKALLVSRMQESVRVLQNKVRFVLAVVQGKLVVHNRKRKDLLAELQSEGYYCMPKKKQPPRPAASESDEEDEASTGGADNDETAGVPADQADLATGFDYLLSQKIWALTMERVHALRNELADQEAGLADLVATPETVLWQRDLDAVVRELDDSDLRRAEDAAADAVQRSKAGGRPGASKRRVAPAKKNSVQQVEKKADVEHVAVELGKVSIGDQIGLQKVEKPAAAGRKRVSKKTAGLVKADTFIDAYSPVKASPAVKRSRAIAPRPAKPPGKAAPPAKPPPRPAAAAKQKKPPPRNKMLVDKDDEDSDSVETIEEPLAKKTPRPARSTRARKEVIYIDHSDEEQNVEEVDDDDDEDYDDA